MRDARCDWLVVDGGGVCERERERARAGEKSERERDRERERESVRACEEERKEGSKEGAMCLEMKRGAKEKEGWRWGS